jgi:signal transduction histidine kinase
VIAEVLPTIREDLAQHLTQEHQALLKLADRSLCRLRLFVERMRLVADLESSQLSLSLSPTPLVPLVEDVVDAMQRNEPRRGIQVSFDRRPVNPIVDIDASKLTHVLIELLSNAMRHAASQVRISVEQTSHHGRVVVEDDGNGLSDAETTLLYRRFVERQSRNGLGIGLSLTRDLVCSHGGDLSYERSTLPPGRLGTLGARFVVALKLVSGGS